MTKAGASAPAFFLPLYMNFTSIRYEFDVETMNNCHNYYRMESDCEYI